MSAKTKRKRKLKWFEVVITNTFQIQATTAERAKEKLLAMNQEEQDERWERCDDINVYEI